MTENKLEKLQIELHEAHDECLKVLNDDIGDKSTTLYHYTSLEAALEILKNGTLRFTDARYCNDPNEIIEGLKILAEVHMELRMSQKKEEFHFFLFMDAMICTLISTFWDTKDIPETFLKATYENLAKTALPSGLRIHPSSAYICCFSESNDDLRQWIPYARNGEGLGIGFEGVNQEHSITLNNTFIVRVSYATIEKKKEYAYAIYKKACEIFLRTELSLIASLMVELQILTMYDIIACKSENYKDEREWRLIKICTNNILLEETSFINSGSIIKPYIDIPLNKDSLIDIILGPKSSNSLNHISLKKILTKYNYKKTTISNSNVLYR
ncbi:MAG: hypothetical protein A3J37_08470 [Alphaproteobacteria bacterium RIFCSPHIGHO2_12_FULL_45_9]|nr:MAG: hypothetical protein A3B66_06855 [Alphaproteobacteria bacterium RIFCSPHIGHO2_02_FULL_46_13]OFW94469.1 MAG: hypothetical protein A3J37_08470 [Alphaproteobacteria bacterium RIFCSPHIGHO2_12_FULL_45_9]